MVLCIILCMAIVAILAVSCIIGLKQSGDPGQIIRAISYITLFYLGVSAGVLFTFILS